MGEEDKAAEELTLLRPYQVNKEMLEMTGKDTTVVMHCLPAVKDMRSQKMFLNIMQM